MKLVLRNRMSTYRFLFYFMD